MMKRSAQLSPTTHKVRLLTSLITECLKLGGEKNVNSSCKYMMLCLFNIPKPKRKRRSPRFWRHYDILLSLLEEDDLKSHTT